MSGSLPSPPCVLSFADMATSLSEIHQAHAHMLKTGLFRSTFAASRLISSAVASSADPLTLSYAHSLFDRIPHPNSYLWNTMIRAHTKTSDPDPEPALLLFHHMLHSPVLPDKFTFPFVLKACSLQEALQMHARILKTGFDSDIFVQNTLIHVYANAGCTNEAFKLFNRMPDRDVISWNALVRAHAARGLMDEAQKLFDEMPDRNVESWNFMISGYANLGLVELAWGLFDQMPVRDLVSWNAMITGCTRAGCFSNVLALFHDMQNGNVCPDNCTLVSVLSACGRVGALGQGEWIHAYIDKNCIEIEGFIATALVDMYSKCGSIEKALRVFHSTLRKDVSTWNAMIDGFSSHGLGDQALRLFAEMPANGFVPNEITFVSVLSACSHTGLLDEGRQVFDSMVRVYGIEPRIEHYGCVVDLLGRAGLLEEAEGLILEVPLKGAQVLWESLLSACRNHGNVKLAECVAKRLVELSPRDSTCYLQLSNVYASMGRWKDVREVRAMMREQRIKKEPGCSTIEVDGIIHEFFAGD